MLFRCWLVAVLGVVLGPAICSGADVETISKGERVELTEHLATGKLTLVDFYADWCGPCRSLAPTLNRLAANHANRLALRKVDVSSWSSPVAAQYQIRSIPHFKLFDENGSLVAQGNAGAVFRTLEKRLGGGGSQAPIQQVAKSRRSPLPAILVIAALTVVTTMLLRRSKGGSRQGPRSDCNILRDLLLQKVIQNPTNNGLTIYRDHGVRMIGSNR